MHAEHVRRLTCVVVGRAKTERTSLEATAARAFGGESRERSDPLGEAPGAHRPGSRGPRSRRVWLRGEKPGVVIGDRDRARGRGDHDPVGPHVLERRDRILRHRDRRRPIPAVELRQTAAAAAFDHVHLAAEALEHACRGVAGRWEEVVDDARRKERDLHVGCRRIGLRHFPRAVVERVIGDGWKALLLRDRAEGKANDAVTAQRILKRRQPPGDPIDALG